VGGAGGRGIGGGIYNTGNLALVNCTLALNEARGGNGGRGSDANANFAFRGGNGASGLGGAIWNGGVLNLTNCTLSSNQVFGGTGGNGGEGGLAQAAGGRGGSAEGAGLFNQQTAFLVHATVAGGVAQHGLGGFGQPNGAPGVASGSGVRTVSTIQLLNTLVARNILTTGNSATNGPDVAGAFLSQGHNLIAITNNASGWIASDLVGNGTNFVINPLLGPLQDNGGPTPTMALLPGSPAVDQGKATGVIADQRRHARPFDYGSISNAVGGNGSDIGAFELGEDF
jgi:hypothetical protein